MIYSFCVVFTPRVTPIPKIGLWTLSPGFLSGFNPPWAHDPFFTLVSGFPKSRDFPEPTIPFYPWSAVSPSKPRDFRVHEPAILFSHLVSGFPLKTTWSLSTNQKPPYAPYEPNLLLPICLFIVREVWLLHFSERRNYPKSATFRGHINWNSNLIGRFSF